MLSHLCALQAWYNIQNKDDVLNVHWTSRTVWVSMQSGLGFTNMGELLLLLLGGEQSETEWVRSNWRVLLPVIESMTLNFSYCHFRDIWVSNLAWKCLQNYINGKHKDTLKDMGRTSLTPLWDSLYFAASLGLGITGGSLSVTRLTCALQVLYGLCIVGEVGK